MILFANGRRLREVNAVECNGASIRIWESCRTLCSAGDALSLITVAPVHGEVCIGHRCWRAQHIGADTVYPDRVVYVSFCRSRPTLRCAPRPPQSEELIEALGPAQLPWSVWGGRAVTIWQDTLGPEAIVTFAGSSEVLPLRWTGLRWSVARRVLVVAPATIGMKAVDLARCAMDNPTLAVDVRAAAMAHLLVT